LLRQPLKRDEQRVVQHISAPGQRNDATAMYYDRRAEEEPKRLAPECHECPVVDDPVGDRKNA
jgi:hypothetical protein